MLPPSRSLKLAFLDELASIAQPDDTPWLIAGDFNLICFPSEKNNTAFRPAEANAFNQTLDNLALIELPLLDRRFTWSNNRASPTLERLDRVFFNLAWADTFPNTSLSSRSRFTSDHVPFLIHVTTSIPRSSFFKFEAAWANSRPCKDIVAQIWAAQPSSPTNATTFLVSTLKNLMPVLRLGHVLVSPPTFARLAANLQSQP